MQRYSEEFKGEMVRKLTGPGAMSAALRAPLAYVADEVFLSLSDELEQQGVPPKVVADMFGIALRSFQRRVQRLRESGTEKGAPSGRRYLNTWRSIEKSPRERLYNIRH